MTKAAQGMKQAPALWLGSVSDHKENWLLITEPVYMTQYLCKIWKVCVASKKLSTFFPCIYDSYCIYEWQWSAILILVYMRSKVQEHCKDLLGSWYVNMYCVGESEAAHCWQKSFSFSWMSKKRSCCWRKEQFLQKLLLTVCVLPHRYLLWCSTEHTNGAYTCTKLFEYTYVTEDHNSCYLSKK